LTTTRGGLQGTPVVVLVVLVELVVDVVLVVLVELVPVLFVPVVLVVPVGCALAGSLPTELNPTGAQFVYPEARLPKTIAKIK